MPAALLKRLRRTRTRPEETIHGINALSPSAFADRFLAPDSPLRKHLDYDITLKPVAALGEHEFQSCFGLIELTSAADYKASSQGWRPKDKQREMREDNMQYLLVRRRPCDDRQESLDESPGSAKEAAGRIADVNNAIVAFLAFMFTIEDDHPVIYIYEIHLAEAQRGCGLGKHLMCIAEHCAREGSVAKVMLTCFRRNAVAMNFYTRLGYGEDEFSPPAKRLRGGKVKLPSYMIMSKSVG